METLSTSSKIKNYAVRQKLSLQKCLLLFYICSPMWFGSCMERYRTVDATEFNKQIAADTTLTTATALIQAFYPQAVDAPPQNITITEDGNDTNFRIVLIHKNLEDDSIENYKIIMLARKQHKTWHVFDIKTTWQCRQGRGHSAWSNSNCI